MNSLLHFTSLSRKLHFSNNLTAPPVSCFEPAHDQDFLRVHVTEHNALDREVNPERLSLQDNVTWKILVCAVVLPGIFRLPPCCLAHRSSAAALSELRGHPGKAPVLFLWWLPTIGTRKPQDDRQRMHVHGTITFSLAGETSMLESRVLVLQSHARLVCSTLGPG